MAYVKTTWVTGDTITAVKLNNMENGIESHDPLVFDLTDETWSGESIFTIAMSQEDLTSALTAKFNGKNVVAITPANGETFGVIHWTLDSEGAFQANPLDYISSTDVKSVSFSVSDGFTVDCSK